MKKSSSAGDSGQPDVSNVSEHGIPPPGSNTAATPSILPSAVTSRASSAAGVSRPSSAAAAAFQQASVAYHEAIMAKRLDIVQQMQASLADTTTVAYQSIAAYSHYLEGIFSDLAFEVFQEGQDAPQGVLEAQVRDTELVLPLYEPSPQGVDLFGQVIPHAPTERVACMHCDWEGAAARFAAHLDKCLSGGRNCRRAGRARG